jgi:hypothetical protein
VGIKWSPHALGRLIVRITPGWDGPSASEIELMSADKRQLVLARAVAHGLPFREIEARIRQPNAGKADEASRQHSNRRSTRYLRWFTLPDAPQRTTCGVVFQVVEESADQKPGSILLITVLPPEHR